MTRLAGKYRWLEFPTVITGNNLPGKYSKFWQSGKYEIELKYSAIFFHKFKLTAHISYCLCTYSANKL